jgi:hypothetical protein
MCIYDFGKERKTDRKKERKTERKKEEEKKRFITFMELPCSCP